MIHIIPISAENPGNVPRRIKHAFAEGWHVLPATAPQLRKLRVRFSDVAATNEDIAVMFGDEFVGLDHLSKHSASWALDQLQAAADRARYAQRARETQADLDGLPPEIATNVDEHFERQMKHMIADYYRNQGAPDAT
jgi:hypothetical protein